MNDNVVTIGMDVSNTWSQVAVLDDGGNVVLEERVATKPPAVRKFFKRFTGARIALEVGQHSPWLSRLLGELGLEGIVGNPRKVGLISASDRKSDRVDAQTLARLARLDPELLFPVQHRREDTQAMLAVLRAREALVSARTKLINSVRGQVKAIGGRMPKGTSASFHKHVERSPRSSRRRWCP